MAADPLVLRRCRVDPVQGTALFHDGHQQRLTPRELALLLYLADHADRVVSREELLEVVWGYRPAVVSRAVDTTVRRLREKIEADAQQPDHVLTAFGEGYRFVPLALDGAVDERAPADPEDEPFVGREAELGELVAWLSTPGPAALLVGPPGAGKTRLARRAAAVLGPALAGGAVLVDVTEARDLPQVAHAVALSLGLQAPQVADGTLARVGRLLVGLGPVLLVLDNCEGASAAVAEVTRRLLEAAPEARLLATSRELLPGRDQERTLQVQPLPLPDAVALFEVLARRVRPGFTVGPEVRPVVEALVEKLERIPLAVALAAGRAGAMSPRALLERLDDRFRLLRSRERDNPRQRTLRAALDWSWELLSEGERETLTACSAFRGGFDLPAALAVVDRPDAEAELRSLCARSLLERRQDRFGGYAFVREYATERLAEHPERERAVHERHGAFFRERARTSGVDTHERGRRLTRDRGNLVEATRRAVRAGRSEVAAACALGALDVIGREGPFELGVELVREVVALPGLSHRDLALFRLRQVVLEQAVGHPDVEDLLAAALRHAEASGDRAMLAEALRGRGAYLRTLGRSLEAVEELERALAVAREVGGSALHNVLTTLANALRELGRLEDAYATWIELERLTRAEGERAPVRVHVLGNMALVARRRGEVEPAEALYREAVEISAELGDRRGEAIGQMGLGNLLLDLGRLDEARACYAVGLHLAREVGELDTAARFHGNLALVERACGRLDAAAEHLRIALAEFERLGEPRQLVSARANLGELLLLRGETDEGLELLAEAASWMRQAGDGPQEAEILGSATVGLLRQRRTAEAREAVDRAEHLARSSGNPLAITAILARRGLVELAEGGPEAARRTLREIEDLDAPAGERSDAGRAVLELRAALEETA